MRPQLSGMIVVVDKDVVGDVKGAIVDDVEVVARNVTT